MQHGKKFEVLKDRSKNLPDHGGALATVKESTGVIRPGDLSLRKLRAQVKQKVSRLNTSKPFVCKETAGVWNSVTQGFSAHLSQIMLSFPGQ